MIATRPTNEDACHSFQSSSNHGAKQQLEGPSEKKHSPEKQGETIVDIGTIHHPTPPSEQQQQQPIGRFNQGFIWHRDTGFHPLHTKYYLPDEVMCPCLTLPTFFFEMRIDISIIL